MNVELTINWQFLSTPPALYAVTVFWRIKGSTAAYTSTSVANGESGTINITTIANSGDTINTACILEYEGYIIPNCFIGTATDCNPFLPDLVSPNPACTLSNRDYWEASVDATDKQSCRGVEVTCVKSGVISVHLVDPSQLLTNTWLNAPGGIPDLVLPVGTSFYATPNNYNSVTGKIIGDCWIINTPGSNVTIPPVVTLIESDQGNILPLVITLGCNNFNYSNCASTFTTSGNILVGETRTVCIDEKAIASFEPEADNSEFSHTLLGCCTGNGRTYTLTFNNPDVANYSTVTFLYGIANNTAQGAQFTHPLTDGIPYTTTCIVQDSIAAAYITAGTLLCETDFTTNIWLFENYVTIVDNGPC